MTRRLPPPLVALSPGDLHEAPSRAFVETLKRAVGAGLRGFLLREPGMGDRASLALARECRAALGEGGWFALHDRAHLAAECRADAVHLGFQSLAPVEAREILPVNVAIGLSAHEPDSVSRWEGTDYLFFGPVLDTPSKRGLVAPTGFEGLARAVARSAAPIWAIGGIKPEHASACLEAGCSGISVLSGILPAPDPASACSAYLRALAAFA